MMVGWGANCYLANSLLEMEHKKAALSDGSLDSVLTELHDTIPCPDPRLRVRNPVHIAVGVFLVREGFLIDSPLVEKGKAGTLHAVWVGGPNIQGVGDELVGCHGEAMIGLAAKRIKIN